MGTKSKKKAKTRLDAYYRLAKDQGYRARSAFKLIQLNRKYDFLAKSRSCVDLCAAPGGWCQVAAKFMPIGSTVIGVDLVPIAPIRGVKTFVGDITDEKTRKTIHIYMKKQLVDCVIHDGAPNVGGVWARDLFQQNALVLCALKIGTALLKQGGWFVSKVFRSQDFHKIIWVLKQLFDKVEATKPLASRMESAEIFVVCAGYKAPKNIDPKLFNPTHVFSDVSAEKVMTPSGLLVAPKNNVPQGYETFNTIDTRVATVEEFLTCQDPKEFLQYHYEIRFGEDDQDYLKSKWTKKELLYAMQDLQQVGQGDRRRLVRWREQILREHKRAQGDDDDVISVDGSEAGAAAGSDDEADGEKAASDDEEAMANELLKMRKSHEKDVKKKMKRIVDRKLKQVRGLINHDPHEGAQHPTDMDGQKEANDEDMGEGDWAMASIKKLGDMDVAGAFDKHWEEQEDGNMPLNAITDVHLQQDDEINMGGENAGDDYDDRLHVEEGNEEAYDVDNYGNYILAERSARVAVYDGANQNDHEDTQFDDEPEDQEDPEDEEERKALKKQKVKEARQQKDEADLDEAGKQSKWQRRHLNIDKVLNRTFPKPKDGKRGRNQEERIDMKGEGSIAGTSSAGGARTAQGQARREGQERLRDESDDDSDVSDLPSEDDDDDLPEINKGRGNNTRQKKAIVPDQGKLTVTELTKLQRKALAKENKDKKKKKGKGKDTTAFEEIPIAMADPEVRARTLAMATRMLDKRTRTDMLDAAVNKFMHNDDDDLPDWFLKDEQRNCQVNLPVTASDMENERQRFLEISSRPGKKIAEAIGRKHRRAQRMLRGMIEKGKIDPRMREKTAGLSVRKLMRSTAIGGGSNAAKKKKFNAMDQKKLGEKKREKNQKKKGKFGKHANRT